MAKDINDLDVTINSFLSAQTVWNEKHDKRSSEVLQSIDRKTTKLFDLHENLIEKVGALNCGQAIVNQKIAGTDKRLDWLWRIIGVTALAMLFKAVYEYIKSPGG